MQGSGSSRSRVGCASKVRCPTRGVMRWPVRVARATSQGQPPHTAQKTAPRTQSRRQASTRAPAAKRLPTKRKLLEDVTHSVHRSAQVRKQRSNTRGHEKARARVSALVSPRGSSGALEALVGPITESREAHLRRHSGGLRSCPRCRWYLFGHR